uniref:hypothetical protein n=1 Tax=Salmonella sp. s51228 TaxID=3159652 RepID=UPI003980CD0C
IRISVRSDDDDTEFLKQTVDTLLLACELRSSGILWVIKDLKDKFEQNANLWGPAFYIGRYYFKIKVEFNYADPTKAMGVFIAMFKGRYDEELPWPLKLHK